MIGSSNASGSSTGRGPTLALQNIDWDFVIGSDLIYNDTGSTCLPKVMVALARPATKVRRSYRLVVECR